MFRHQKKNRKFIHNLRLATLLSLVAGIVNITGVLSLKTLTTNVTGHFAFFAEEATKQDYFAAITFLVFTIFFLMGAFTSNFMAELISKKNPNLSHIFPILLEIIILVVVGLFGFQTEITENAGKTMAFALLFAMGLQNALVTKISKSIVRTTHLTGIFTDLGIELSQLFFYKNENEINSLKTNIFLKFSIIAFFFLGCFFGGFLYSLLKMKTLLIAALFLLLAVYYDYMRLKYYLFKRKVIRSK